MIGYTDTEHLRLPASHNRPDWMSVLPSCSYY